MKAKIHTESFIPWTNYDNRHLFPFARRETEQEAEARRATPNEVVLADRR